MSSSSCSWLASCLSSHASTRVPHCNIVKRPPLAAVGRTGAPPAAAAPPLIPQLVGWRGAADGERARRGVACTPATARGKPVASLQPCLRVAPPFLALFQCLPPLHSAPAFSALNNKRVALCWCSTCMRMHGKGQHSNSQPQLAGARGLERKSGAGGRSRRRH